MAYGETKGKMVSLSLLRYQKEDGIFYISPVFTARNTEVTQMLLLALGHSLMGEK